MAMSATLRRMEQDDITVHGMRSVFRDWAAERTNYPNHVVEMALAHVVGDKVEAAYRRGDLFAKRVRLMADWAKFNNSTTVGPSNGSGITPFVENATSSNHEDFLMIFYNGLAGGILNACPK